MAHMIPDVPPDPGPGRVAERALYEALESQLPDDFFVYHSVSYLEQQKAAEGEADFLILHREHGLLAIECKGHGVRRTDAGQWSRIHNDGTEEPLKEDPFRQAQRTVKDLVKELTRRLQDLMPHLDGRFPFVHGHGVAFPRTMVDELNLPLDAQRSIILDASDMNRIEQKALDAYSFWKGDRPDRTPLDKRAFKVFRKRVLQPNLNLVSSLGAQLQLNTQRMVRLTEEQLIVLRGLLSNPRLQIAGGAGTGKTVLALEAAQLLADKGMRVLLMCYNQGLCSYLAEALEDREPGTGSVEVHTFHGLCRKAYDSLELPFAVPTSSDPETVGRFWNESAPLMLMQALDEGKIGPWDAVVIDEGQDFSLDWWAVIEGCLKDKAAARLIVFYDPRQEIFGRGCNIPEFGLSLSLRCNFRNTRRIFQAMQEVVEVDMEPHPRCPDGVEVQRKHPASRNRTHKAIEELLSTTATHG